MSNFLLWEIAYAELYFTEKKWPDFRVESLKKAIEAFSGQETIWKDLRRTGEEFVKKMKQRTITGIVAGLGLLLLIYYGSIFVITAVVLFCALLACLEYDQLFFEKRNWSRLGQIFCGCGVGNSHSRILAG